MGQFIKRLFQPSPGIKIKINKHSCAYMKNTLMRPKLILMRICCPGQISATRRKGLKFSSKAAQHRFMLLG